MASSEASETKSIITSLLTSNPLRCTIKQLCDDFRNIVGYNIPVRKLGFSNVEQYLRSIPDTVHISGSGLTAEVEGVIKGKSAHISAMVVKQKKDSIPAHKRKNVRRSQGVPEPLPLKNRPDIYEDTVSSRVPKNIQNNLRKLIMKFPEGIWCSKLPQEYRRMFRMDLCYEKYHYRSVIEMCTDLPEIFHYIQPKDDDYMLFEKDGAVPSLNQNEIGHALRRDVVEKVPNVDWSLGTSLIPNDIVHFLQEIPQFNLADIKVGDFVDICIGEIHSIGNFWIFPKYGNLDDLLLELQKFFRDCENRYVIPEIFIEEGLYCTVYHKNKYHRCVVIKTSLPCVEVLFIDYGSIGKVKASDVWYLPEQFGKLPSQAIRASLSKILPVSAADTVGKFRQLIKNAELVAEVINKDAKEKTLEIYLANVTDEENIFYVNDALVEKGYAEYH